MSASPTARTSSPALLLIAALLLGSIAAHAGDDEVTAAALVEEGKTLFRSKDYAAAFAKFRAAADLDKAQPNALYNAALAARKAGLLEDAATAYTDLLRLHGDDLDAVYGLAETQRALAHYEEARALYERYLRDEVRPERTDLKAKATASLAALPPMVARAPTPALERPASDDVAPAPNAQALFEEGQALAKQQKYDAAAARFLAALAADPTRIDALLRAALMMRKHDALDDAKAAYERVLASTTAPEQVLDATYGLAETERLRGDKPQAIALFTRYADNEHRPGEERYAARAREMAAALASELATAAAPGVEPAIASVAAPAFVFFGDALLVDQLVDKARAADAAGNQDAGRTLWSRVAALSPHDARLPAAAPTTCEAVREQALGELAMTERKPDVAVAAFQRARACDPARAAPLWGLSRAFDALGDKKGAKHHAALYLRSNAPDRDATSTSAATWRAEQPD